MQTNLLADSEFRDLVSLGEDTALIWYEVQTVEDAVVTAREAYCWEEYLLTLERELEG